MVAESESGWESVLALARAFVAFVIVFALAFEFQRVVDTGFEAANFFSYFTVVSNTLAAGLLLWEALWRPPSTHGPGVAAIRGAVTLYMCMTGIVYAVLLAPSDVGKPEPWVDFVIHVVGPIAMVLDWTLVSPRRLPGRHVVLAWLAWPLVYLGYSLVRGGASDWYPYPFLDPDESGGYAGVAGYSVVVLIGFAAAGFVLHWLGARRPSSARRALAPSGEP